MTGGGPLERFGFTLPLDFCRSPPGVPCAAYGVALARVLQEPGTPNETAEIELICNGEGLSPLDGLDSSEEKDEAWVRDIWAVPNRAIVASYFSVGFALKFLFAPLSYYMVHELGE